MTRPRDAVHAPHCDQPEPRAERVGSWTVTRCPTCRAVGIRKTADTTGDGDTSAPPDDRHTLRQRARRRREGDQMSRRRRDAHRDGGRCTRSTHRPLNADGVRGEDQDTSSGLADSQGPSACPPTRLCSTQEVGVLTVASMTVLHMRSLTGSSTRKKWTNELNAPSSTRRTSQR